MAAKHMKDPIETFMEDAGTPLKVAVEVFRKIGSVPEKDFPFNQDFSDGYYSNTFFAMIDETPV